MTTDRRRFLSVAGGAAAALTAASYSRVYGANERVGVAVIGVNGRGKSHISAYAKNPGAEIRAVVDIDQAVNERAASMVVKEQGGQRPKEYSDMRKMFESKDIDAVSIATPNYWHALSTIWACQAGKDVYVEKPASHNIWEGRKMVEAARKYKRMVQVGQQSRSTPYKIEAIEMLKDGVIGDVYMAKGLCFKRRKSIGLADATPVPPGVDYDLWLGPAHPRAFKSNRFHYNWHWYWDFGNGDIGNQGVHEMDICRWALGLEPGDRPSGAVSTGGKYVWKDDQETPNTQQASFDYGDRQIVFDVRNLNTGTESQIPLAKSVVGNLIYGSEGFMVLHPEGYQVYIGDDRDKTVDEKYREQRVWDPRPHMANFLDAASARDRSKLHADVATGCAAADLCHYANTSYRVKQRLAINPQDGYAAGDAGANEILSYPGREPYRV